jgi:hypothetical protein
MIKLSKSYRKERKCDTINYQTKFRALKNDTDENIAILTAQIENTDEKLILIQNELKAKNEELEEKVQQIENMKKVQEDALLDSKNSKNMFK